MSAAFRQLHMSDQDRTLILQRNSSPVSTGGALAIKADQGEYDVREPAIVEKIYF
jgi:hypothetical protein